MIIVYTNFVLNQDKRCNFMKRILDNDKVNIIGPQIKKLRKQAGLSQRQLSEKLFPDPSGTGQAEGGDEAEPERDRLLVLREAQASGQHGAGRPGVHGVWQERARSGGPQRCSVPT